MEGWIKLHRKLLNSNVFQNEKLLKIWIWCLLKATHQDYQQLIGNTFVDLKSGEFIFGRRAASEELNINPNTLYKNIKLLEKMRQFSHKKQQQIFYCKY